MTPERRLQILRHVPTIACLEELDGFRSGLCAQGEMQDAEVYEAVRIRGDDLAQRARLGLGKRGARG